MRLARRRSAAWGLEVLEDPTRPIVGELVTNAVRDSHGPIRLRLIRHEVLTVEVSDADVGSPPPQSARIVDENGRGLAMVARLSRRWGTRPVAGGRVLWAEADLAQPSGR
ncbi:ATP-binding protein [Streptomyces sp. NPDC007883]|uniref:ATP-binding protein n=1 Tax=Streptomyces sp. NPDC007883 TaxID=3155116 RepID=UPI00340C082D